MSRDVQRNARMSRECIEKHANVARSGDKRANSARRTVNAQGEHEHSSMKQVQLITDGACIGNPGPGGWAYILRYGEHTRERYGAEPHTTNNRMELTAAIRGLQALKESCAVEVITDSEYVKNG